MIDNRLLLFGIIIFVFHNCHAIILGKEITMINDLNPEVILNNNMKSIQQLVIQQEKDGIIESIEFLNSFTKIRFCDSEDEVAFFNMRNQDIDRFPALSIVPYEGRYYWSVAGDCLLDEDGAKIIVTDNNKIPVFSYNDGRWQMTVGNHTIAITERQLTNNMASITVVNDVLAVISLPFSYQMTIPLMSFTPPLVPQQSFYKDVFLDAGIGLTSRKTLYAAKYLGLSTECISLPRRNATKEDENIQNAIIAGDDIDKNGRLLYPDGQPRYRLIFVNGGDSRTHGKSLSDDARKNMRSFVIRGGSYVGTCAGAFLVSTGYDSIDNYPYYLSLWPSTLNHTGVSGGKTGMLIEKCSPLLNYYDFGGDNYVDDIRHNKGGYPVNLPEDTEVLGLYDCPDYKGVHLQPGIWAYKSNNTMGRIIMEGSHPEEKSSGEKRDLTAAMMLYALDGIGQATIKGFLQNGKVREMTSCTEEDNPSFSKIGDMQSHYFVTYIPKGAQNITFSLVGLENCDMQLSISKGTITNSERAEYRSPDKGAIQQLSFENMEEGLWYVNVRCMNTVEIVKTDYGQSYIDNWGVLNGKPYQIQVLWGMPQMPSSVYGSCLQKQPNRKGIYMVNKKS